MPQVKRRRAAALGATESNKTLYAPGLGENPVGVLVPLLENNRLVDTSLSHSEVFKMSKTGKRYTREFRHQIVQLVRSGSDMRELTKEFGVRFGRSVTGSSGRLETEAQALEV
jgi:hypothetical protein